MEHLTTTDIGFCVIVYFLFSVCENNLNICHLTSSYDSPRSSPFSARTSLPSSPMHSRARTRFTSCVGYTVSLLLGMRQCPPLIHSSMAASAIPHRLRREQC
jgi:hypothetical protein